MSTGTPRVARATSSEDLDRYREGLVLGVLAGLLSSLPAALRTVDGIWAVLGLGGAVAFWSGPVFGALKLFRRPARWLTIPLLGGAWSFGVLALLGTLLKESTHHRPLGAVTFAVIAAGLLVFASIVAARLIRLKQSSDGRVAGWTLAALTTGAVLVAAWQARSLLITTPDGFWSSLVDLALLLVLGALALRLSAKRPLPPKLTRFAPLVYLVVLALTVAAWFRPKLGERLLDAAPVLAWPGWFS